MSRQLLLITSLVLLLHLPCHASDYGPSTTTRHGAYGGRQVTEFQKQSDYHNRVNRTMKERKIEKQVASVGALETETGGLDNFVMMMLVVSAGILFFVARRISVRRKRRRRARSLPLR